MHAGSSALPKVLSTQRKRVRYLLTVHAASPAPARRRRPRPPGAATAVSISLRKGASFSL
jgi:hypothetical protein